MAEELPPDVSIGRIAEFGALIGDPARIGMLVALLSGDRLSASALAERAGVTPQTASGHLSRLVAGGLVDVLVVGRQRLHGFASAQVEGIVRQLYLGGDRLRRSPAAQMHALTFARCCSGHLAGRLATELVSTLVDLESPGRPHLREHALGKLQLFGLDVTARLRIQLCRDWSEHRPHLAGKLGRVILDRSLALGWLRQNPGSSALSVTAGGVEGFRNRFGISL